MSSYATIKGCAIKPYRIERSDKGRRPSMRTANHFRERTFIQWAFLRTEDYVFIPSRTWRDASTGASWTYPAVIRNRPVFRLIKHTIAL